MRTPLFASVVLLLTACNGTNTGNPVDSGGDGDFGGGVNEGDSAGEGGSCKVDRTTVIGADEMTPLGFTAGEVLDFVVGEHTETLTWHELAIASYGPEQGEQGLTVEVTHDGGELRYVELAADTGGAEIFASCPPRLELDVEIGLRTDGGALDERFEATLRARSPLLATYFTRPDPHMLGGSFAIEEVREEGYELAQLELRMQFSPYGTAGWLTPVFERRTADAVSAAAGGGPDGGGLASWGPAGCQGDGVGVPVDEEVAAFSGQDVLDLLGEQSGVPFIWDDAEATLATIAFDHDADSGVCATVIESGLGEGAVGSLTLLGELVVATEDGRVDARWPVRVVGSPDGTGALSAVRVTYDGSRSTDSDDPEADYGISGVDASGYDSLGFSLDISLSPGVPLGGSMELIGYELPDCPEPEPQPDEGGGVSSPGCPGATPVTLARADIDAQ
ncbi:MAG: hypothetical protein PVI30_00820 [Myxococcales bacterium]|jgi:hypothetical protein